MQEQQTVEVIYGINPVKEALRAGMPIERAYTCKAQGAVLPLIGQLKALKVPILEVDEKRMSFLCPKEEGRMWRWKTCCAWRPERAKTR